jgi:uncharacterized protein (TIGR02996 family)
MSIAPLIDHLRHHPGDAASWLVYGDHLSGQGDLRGELIRLEDLRLDTEIRALIKAHQPAWQAQAPAGSSVRLEWQHGFIVGVALRWVDSSAQALETFLASPNSVHLRTLAITGLGELEEGSGDEEMDEDSFDEETGKARVRFDAAAMEGALEPLFALDLSRLTTLSFAYLGMQATGAKLLAKATNLAQLRQLDLRFNALGNKGLEALAHAPFLPQLEALHLQSNDLGPPAMKVLAALELPHLTRLDLRWNKLKSTGAKTLAGSPLVSRLTRLGLQREDVGAAGVKALAHSPFLPLPLRTFWKGLHATPAEQAESD